MKHFAVPVLLAFVLIGCGSAEEPPVEQIVVREPGEVATAAAQLADKASDPVAAGEAGFAACAACHVAKAGAASGIGPNLYGVVGREAGALPNFGYSDAMASADFVWDEARLNAYLGDPNGVVPGTSMVAGAVSDAAKREAIIAYLATLSE
ncbi:c-type cytochrome [Erythrobacter litoralis]|uniref:Cytochrome c family protein n=1 Tax=Erythrobacter litoralis (strain HTCC2594) TaxID=314225 RepID=Q2N7K5_ERYLH|nr:c-type cytochrome [Erythrobacter litoralis]ABC64336.1 cytochrome c family protein [Erythrobacter litoralis HTCC2594]